MCTCACMCVFTCVCAYVFVCVYAYVRVDPTCMHAYVYTTYMRMCVRARACVRACLFVIYSLYYILYVIDAFVHQICHSLDAFCVVLECPDLSHDTTVTVDYMTSAIP